MNSHCGNSLVATYLLHHDCINTYWFLSPLITRGWAFPTGWTWQWELVGKLKITTICRQRGRKVNKKAHFSVVGLSHSTDKRNSDFKCLCCEVFLCNRGWCVCFQDFLKVARLRAWFGACWKAPVPSVHQNRDPSQWICIQISFLFIKKGWLTAGSLIQVKFV